MRTNTLVRAAFGLGIVGLLGTPAVHGQAGPAHTHMGHVADEFRSTPEGQGLLPTAVAEAEIAAQHAGFAGRDPSNLDGMKRHIGHVINAMDPTEVENGPGLGFGVKAAAEGVVRHIELAAGSDGASDNVKAHANHIATATGNVITRADAVIALARQIQEATDADAAAAMVEELIELTNAIVSGTDENGDGRTGWQEGEGGLAQATQHMGLMKRAEGMGD